MDYFQCENCKVVFDEFEMNFRYAQDTGETLCRACIKEKKKEAPNDPKANRKTIST